MKKAELIFMPDPGIGHLYSTIEFVKLLLERDIDCQSRFLSSDMQQIPPSMFSETDIRFIELPQTQPPQFHLISKSIENFLSDYVASHRDYVKDAIVKHALPRSPQIAGVVVDLFSTSLIGVANETRLPSYLFFTSGAAFLGFMLYLPTWHDKICREFEESDPEAIVPGCKSPVPASCLPSFAFNKEGGYIWFLNHIRRFKETKSIIINTFQELQPYAFSSLTAYNVPSVYAVGPLIDFKNHQNNQESERSPEHNNIMKWLDDQPYSSVVLLCFGCWGRFDVPQLREIALGLEQNGQRFLWSMRAASVEQKHPGEIFPEGFQERTKEKGLIICGWAPQLEVLAHKAVGGTELNLGKYMVWCGHGYIAIMILNYSCNFVQVNKCEHCNTKL